MERLLAEGVPPVRLTFNSLIKASRSDPQRGEHWYRAMRQAGIQPNIQTFNKVGMSFYFFLLNVFANVNCLLKLIQNFTERGDTVSAMRWFEAAKAEPGIELDEVMYVVHLYHTLFPAIFNSHLLVSDAFCLWILFVSTLITQQLQHNVEKLFKQT